MNWFFVDTECDGLYGPFLSVAALVTTSTGRELDRFYGAVTPDPDELRSPWVRENVLPFLGRAERRFDSEEALLEAFWQFWMAHRETARCVADVGVPVEARLFARCVQKNLEERTFLAPYPLFDLSTLLESRGLDWKGDRQALSGLTLSPHDAMDDVRMLAEIWLQLTKKPPMRVQVSLRTNGLRLPLAYNDILQGFIYSVLSDDPAYSGFLHDAGYRAGNKVFKLFTYSGLIGEYAVDGKVLECRDRVLFELRSPDAALAQAFFDACRPKRQFLLNGQKVTVGSRALSGAPQLRGTALVSTVSPITVHSTDDSGHTSYYSPYEPAFYERVARNAQRKWSSYYGDAPFAFSIEPTENREYRRLVTTFKDTYITAWHGEFLLRGTPRVLDFLYHTGLGDRNSQGFGMFSPRLSDV